MHSSSNGVLNLALELDMQVCGVSVVRVQIIILKYNSLALDLSITRQK